MDFSDLLNARRSVRKFKSTPVKSEALVRILEAANSAPSAHNLQAYQIVVVREKERRKALAAACMEQEKIVQAPITLVFFADPSCVVGKYSKLNGEKYCILDATIAASYAQLAVANEGLGTVWVGAFEAEAVKKALNAPEYSIPVAVFPIGYAAETPGKQTRRTLRDLVKQEHF
ncbi:MAG: nitroreductase family protein [Candidatus Burarchaeum sp.]|nr:nitroreductase family protein [Candidatus Burarchaeum sp.]MDO8339399.1 nitroreductase family protein [Candidatus Burarchaeum sp.]